jgi:hypothetical protein
MKISITELLELERMLNAGNEDYEVAVNNIKNLNFNVIYIMLLSKNLNSDKRREFLNYFEIDSVNLAELSFNNLYKEISLNVELIQDEILKEYFYHSIKKLVTQSLDALSLPILDASIKIKWPKCKQ